VGDRAQDREIEKMAPLDEKKHTSAEQVDQTAVRIRRAVTRADVRIWPDKEATEIKLIEVYMPRRGEERHCRSESLIGRNGRASMKEYGNVMRSHGSFSAGGSG